MTSSLPHDVGALNKREKAILDSILSNQYLPLVDYAREAWGLLEPARDYIHNWHIDAICEHLEAAARLEILNLIINIPPRHMKSLLVSVLWPSWVWTFAPETRWMHFSYSEALSLRDAVKARNLMRSDWYQALWGNVWRFSGDMNVKSRFENNHTGFRVSSGVGGLATGEGGDFIVIDDPHKAQETSDKNLIAVQTWWDQTMSTRENAASETVRCLIMQRVHSKDLTGHIFSKMAQEGKQYEILCLPAEKEDTQKYFDSVNIKPKSTLGFEDPRTEYGQLLWPERFPPDVLSELKIELGSYAAAGQLQQRPSPATGGIFKRHWWGFWQYHDQNLPPVQVLIEDDQGNPKIHTCALTRAPIRFSDYAQSWDMTFKKTETGSFVCGQAWGRMARSINKFLIDQVRGRWDITETIAELRLFYNKHERTSRILIEDKANGPAVMSMLKREIPGIVSYTPKGDKTSRANAAAPQCEAGNVYLPHPQNAPWVWGFIDRFANFPNDDDDEVDTLSQMLDVWRPASSLTWGRR